MFKKLIKLTIIGGAFFALSLFADVDTLLKETQKTVYSIDTPTLVKILKEDPNILIIDLRTKGDILNQGGFIKANKVRNIPRDKMEFMIGEEVST